MNRAQIYWDEVDVGDELEGFTLDITARRIALQVSGSQDWYPVHFDAGFARKGGHADVFVNTGFLHAALVRVITDWMGDDGFLKNLRFEMRRQQRPGDTMVCKGRVIGKGERRRGAGRVGGVGGERARGRDDAGNSDGGAAEARLKRGY